MLPTIATGNVGSALAGEYEVANSLRFNSGSTDYLHRTPSGAGNRKTFTISTWIKRGKLQDGQIIMSGADTNNRTSLVLSSNKIFFRNEVSGTDKNITTNRLFRDTSAWYHFVLAVDTTQSTEANRVRIYVNGSEETSFSSSSYPSQNDDTFINNSQLHRIGSQSYAEGNLFDGYMAEFVLIDGSQLTPTSFGEFDEDTGIWKPIDVSGLTFGTNGFYLDFENSGSLGADVSGNGNNFTVNNLTSIDQSTDTCTNNFTTLNPLANLTGSPTFSEGNLKVAGDNSANHNWQTTFVVSSGKWYWELKDLTSSPDGSLLFYDQSIISASHPGYGFVLNTRKKVIDGTPTGSAIGSSAQNDIWSMALDLDNGKMFIARNGTYLESGDPANGTNPFIQTSDGLPSEGVFGGHVYNGSMELNFGSPSFSISSGNSDANGYGNFEYSVPSGYYALCTKNLAEYG
jgi:hypothetical protein